MADTDTDAQFIAITAVDEEEENKYTERDDPQIVTVPTQNDLNDGGEIVRCDTTESPHGLGMNRDRHVSSFAHTKEPKLHAQPGTIDKAKRVERVEVELIKDIDEDVHDESVVITRIYDRDQTIPEKVHCKKLGEEHLNQVDRNWKYNITLGDIELRRITHFDGTQETLWFPMERYPDDYEFGKDEKGKALTPPRKVFVSLKVKRVCDVSNINETFRMRFHMYFNWLPTEADYKDHYKIKQLAREQNDVQLLADWEPKWYPHLEFQNMIEEHVQEWELYPEDGHFRFQKFKDFAKEKNAEVPEGCFDCAHARFIRVKKECEMTFAEELELQSFPFDCQDLSCIIHERTTGGVRCVFLPELRKNNFASIDPRYSVIDEWDLDTAILEFGDAQAVTSRSQSSYAMIVLRLKVKRRWKVFFANIVLLMACLSLLALTTFSLDADEMGDRLSLLITLILTAVAFNYVVFSSLPNVPYLTFMDKYILGSYAFLVALMIESSMIRLSWFTEEIDTICMYSAGVILVLYNVGFTLYGMWLRQDEIKKMAYSSDQVEAEVNLSRPGIRFNYTQRQRSGKGGRLLSFIGSIHASEFMDEKQKAMLYEKQDKMNELYKTQTTRHGYDASEIPDSPAFQAMLEEQLKSNKTV
eukprot:639562_1